MVLTQANPAFQTLIKANVGCCLCQKFWIWKSISYIYVHCCHQNMHCYHSFGLFVMLVKYRCSVLLDVCNLIASILAISHHMLNVLSSALRVFFHDQDGIRLHCSDGLILLTKHSSNFCEMGSMQKSNIIGENLSQQYHIHGACREGQHERIVCQ